MFAVNLSGIQKEQTHFIKMGSIPCLPIYLHQTTKKKLLQRVLSFNLIIYKYVDLMFLFVRNVWQNYCMLDKCWLFSNIMMV